MSADDRDQGDALPVPKKPASRLRRWGFLLAKIGVAAAAFGYVLSRLSWSDLTAALQRITALSVTIAIAAQYIAITLSTRRWRSLMLAHGAQNLPPFWDLLRVYFVGHFYNMYLPGAVGGDVLRGVVVRRSFPDGGATASIAIVLIERLFGLLTVFSLIVLAAPFDSEGRLARKVLPYALLGVLGVGAVILGLTNGQRVAAYLPARIAGLVQNLPALSRPSLLLAALLNTFVIQGLFLVCVHVIVAAIHPSVSWAHSLVAVPMIVIAAYFPLSVAGAGPRDAAMVALYALGGVPRAEGLAASLTVLAVALLVAATGGLWQLIAPVAHARPSEPAP